MPECQSENESSSLEVESAAPQNTSLKVDLLPRGGEPSDGPGRKGSHYRARASTRGTAVLSFLEDIVDHSMADSALQFRGDQVDSRRTDSDVSTDGLEYNYIPIFERPVPCQEMIRGADGEWICICKPRTARASDLVYDLIIVVCLSYLGAGFDGELTDAEEMEGAVIGILGTPVRDYAALYIPIFYQWRAHTFFLNAWETTDCVFLLYWALSMLVMAYIGFATRLCGSDTDRDHCENYSWGVASARGITMLGYCYVTWFNPKYFKSVAVTNLLTDALITFCWIMVGFQDMGDVCGTDLNAPGAATCWAPFMAFWWTGIALDVFRPLISGVLSKFLNVHASRDTIVPYDIPLLVERFQLLVIISLGEVVASAMQTGVGDDDDDPVTADRYVTTGLLVFLIVMIKVSLFDVGEVPHAIISGRSNAAHALARSSLTGVLWVFLHLPLTFSIAVLGAIIDSFRSDGHNIFTAVHALACGVALACILGIITVFDLLNSGYKVQHRRIKKEWRTAFRIVFILLFIALVSRPTWWVGRRVPFFAWTCAIMALEVIVTLYSFKPKQEFQRAKAAPPALSQTSATETSRTSTPITRESTHLD